MQRYLPLGVAAVLVVVVLIVTVVICRGRAPADGDAPEDQFSAIRAREYLEKLLADQQPHPSNSAENNEVRKRLIEQLQSLGMEVEVHSGLDTGLGYQLYNVLAWPKGQQDAKTNGENDETNLAPLLVVSHYDSVPQGPGAGDAGSCICSMLETIRAMQHRPSPTRRIYYLFTDGEELGMRGARLFAESHQLSKQKPIVLNFDARGASGASLTFETHVGNYDLIDDLNVALPFPKLTGSSFVSVYRLMPNATDFHIFQDHGWVGVNSAFIGSPHRYHTPGDTIENLSLYTLQHHGEKVLSLTAHFAQTTEDRLDENGDAVFFDVFGWFLVWWPAWISIPLCVIVLASHVAAVTWRLRKQSRPIDWYCAKQLLFALSLAIVCVALVGFFLPMILRAAGILDARFTQYDPAIIGLFWIAIWTCVFTFVCRACRNLSDESIWSLVWTIALSVNLIITVFLPGFSYYVLLPGVIVALLSWTAMSKRWAAVITTFVYSIVACPTLYLLGIAFGPGMGVVMCPVFLLLLFPMAPLFGSGRVLQSK